MATYRPNDAGFRAMAVGPEIEAAVRAVALKGKAFAEGQAQAFRRTGEYAAGFDVEATVVREGRRQLPRAAAKLINRSDHAAAVEFGNEATRGRGHHVLGRTLAFLKAS